MTQTIYDRETGITKDVHTEGYEAGLTKREHFAGLALQGWLSRCASVNHMNKLEPSLMAEIAVEMADALMAELEKPNE